MGKNDYLKDKLRVNNFSSWDKEFRCLMLVKGVLKEAALQSSQPFEIEDGKDADLRAQLILNTDVMFHTIIDEARSGLNAYEELKDLNEKQDKASKVVFLRELNDLRMKNSESVTEYATRSLRLREKLTKIGSNVSKDDLAIRFLNGLPPPYANFRQIQIAKDVDLDVQKILPALLKVELEVRQSIRAARGVAMNASARPNRGSTRPPRPRAARRDGQETRTCFYCGKKGHVASKCFKKQRDERAGLGGNASANAAHGKVWTDYDAEEPWIVDSGATHHIVKNKADFESLEALTPPKVVTFGDGSKVRVTHAGTANVKVMTDGRETRVRMEDALHVPTATKNLFSLAQAESQGYSALFRGGKVDVRRDNKKAFSANCVNGLYILPTTDAGDPLAMHVDIGHPNARIWHEKLGHPGIARMRRLVKEDMATGLDLKPEQVGHQAVDCGDCADGKMARKSFTPSSNRATRPLELIHTDLAGPFQKTSLSGNNYVAVYLDDYTGYSAVKFLKYKSQATEATITQLTYWENQTKEKVQTVRSDGGGEFVNNDLSAWFDSKGIRHETTVAYTPEQNGRAERLNRTIAEPARTMLHAAGLPLSAWEECFKTSCYLRNRLPTTGRPKTPFEMMWKVKPDMKHLQVIGSTVLAFQPADNRRKLDKKTRLGRLVGYDLNSKAYRVLLKDNRTLIKAHTIKVVRPEDRINAVVNSRPPQGNSGKTKFRWVSLREDRDFRRGPIVVADSDDEDEAPVPAPAPVPAMNQGNNQGGGAQQEQAIPAQGDGNDLNAPGPDDDSDEEGDQHENDADDEDEDDDDVPDLAPDDPEGGVDYGDDDLGDQDEEQGGTADEADEHEELQTPAGRKSKRAAAELAKLRIQNPQHGGYVGVAVVSDWHSSDSDFENDEFGDENDEDALVLAAKTSDMDIVEPSTWEEAMASPQAEEWRLAVELELASLAAHKTWTIEDKPAEVKALPCRWVFKIKRDANGNIERFKARLVAKGFKQVHGVDFEEVFAPVSKHTTLRLVLSEVAARDMELKQADVGTAFLNGELEEEVWMAQPPGFRTGGPAAHCKLHKSIYGLKQAPRAWYAKLNATLKEFGLTASDADPGLYYSEQEGVSILVLVYVDDLLLAGSRKDVDSLMKQLMGKFSIRDLGDATYFLGMEIARDRKNRKLVLSQKKYTKDILRRFDMINCKPRTVPMTAGTKITREGEPLDTALYPYAEAVGALMYLAVCSRPDISYVVSHMARYMGAPTKEHWPLIKGIFQYLNGTVDYGLTYGPSGDLVVYTDSDYAGDVDTRRSTAGMVALNKGAAISWYSKVMPTVALSTCEAEYMAASMAAREALWLRKFNRALGFETRPITLYGDNQGSIKLAKNPIEGNRSKHIAVVWHFLRQQEALRNIQITYVETTRQIANCQTKPEAATAIRISTQAMGLVSHSL